MWPPALKMLWCLGVTQIFFLSFTLPLLQLFSHSFIPLPSLQNEKAAKFIFSFFFSHYFTSFISLLKPLNSSLSLFHHFNNSCLSLSPICLPLCGSQGVLWCGRNPNGSHAGRVHGRGRRSQAPCARWVLAPTAPCPGPFALDDGDDVVLVQRLVLQQGRRQRSVLRLMRPQHVARSVVWLLKYDRGKIVQLLHGHRTTEKTSKLQ
jgi:hypothetical protein